MSQVVVPFQTSFTADGTANVNQVMQETVQPFSVNFHIYIEDISSSNAFKMFKIEEGLSDTSADIVVIQDDSPGNALAVKNALKWALENAKGGALATTFADASANGFLLKDLLEDALDADVAADLSGAALFDILEAEGLINVDVPNDSIGTNGSVATWDRMGEESDGRTAANPNPLLNLVATQLPYGQYSDISEGGNLDSAFAIGDVIVYSFKVNSTLTITPVNQDVTGSNTGVTSGTLPVDVSGAGVAAQGGFNSNEHSYTFNLYIKKKAAAV
jgi:hypothetical protein